MAFFTYQIYDNAMITAGLNEDPRPMISRLNQLLTQALEKHWSPAGVQPDGLVLPLLEPCTDARRGRPLVPVKTWSHTKHKQTLFIWRLENICAGVNLSFRWKSFYIRYNQDLTVQPSIVRLEKKKTTNSAVCDCQRCAPEFTWKVVG